MGSKCLTLITLYLASFLFTSSSQVELYIVKREEWNSHIYETK